MDTDDLEELSQGGGSLRLRVSPEETKQRYEQRIAAIEWEAYGAIAEAARIFELLKLGKPGMEQVTLADLINWLESDVVVRARAHVANRLKEG